MIICIDPGHGGYDAGACGYGLREKDITLKIALKLRDLLKNSCTVVMTRDSDNTVWNSNNDLATRCQIANNSKVDYFLSIHVNAGGGTGFENYYGDNASQQSIQLAKLMHDNLATFYKSKGYIDRGLKSGHLWVLRRTNMPATLIENLFIDNPNDAKALGNDNFLSEIAYSIANALAIMFNLKLNISQKEVIPVVGPFQDVPVTHWAAQDILDLYNRGLLSKDTAFRPDQPITRAETVALLNRVLKYLGK